MTNLTADDLVYGYINGIFPMADTDGTLYWYSPDPRAIIPIDTYHPPKSLRPTLNKNIFEVKVDTNFRNVMLACSKPRRDAEDSWISEEIIDAYTDLHLAGLAHSFEAYIDGELVGGLYGVAIGAAFFGESMFYKVPDASKVAFHFLMETLRERKFDLLDTQFMNENVRRFGAVEIPKIKYLSLLKKAVHKRNHFSEKQIELDYLYQMVF